MYLGRAGGVLGSQYSFPLYLQWNNVSILEEQEVYQVDK